MVVLGVEKSVVGEVIYGSSVLRTMDVGERKSTSGRMRGDKISGVDGWLVGWGIFLSTVWGWA